MADHAPDSSSTATPTHRLWISGVALGLLIALWAYLVMAAPIDTTQGVIQKILYVHVPCWFAAYAGFGVTAVGGALYLWQTAERFDRVAVASAEAGVLFCTLGLIIGPLWAKGTWGHWWAWDPRPTRSYATSSSTASASAGGSTRGRT